MFGAERRQRLLTLARESDRIALEFSLVAAGFAETDECEEDGFESPIAWIKANCHMSGGAAADRVCAGEQLDRLDRSEAAVLAGEIGFAHFAHIARASAAVGERLTRPRSCATPERSSWPNFGTPAFMPDMRLTPMVSPRKRPTASRRDT